MGERGGGLSRRPEFLKPKESTKLNRNLQRGEGGFKPRTSCGGSMDIFLSNRSFLKNKQTLC